MACFIVPGTEAIVTTAITKIVKSHEGQSAGAAQVPHLDVEADVKMPFSRKLGWLNNMLWGGSALLAFEHVWHGEVVPWFPFLTAAQNAADTAVMLHEMSTIGVTMAVIVTAVWGGMVAITGALEKRGLENTDAVEEV